MTQVWSDPLSEALARSSRPAWYDRLGWPLAFGLGVLLYTGAIAWSAYDLGAEDTRSGLICEAPAKVTKHGRTP